jgi:D-alanyl-D-alanine carboxypeptidase
MRKSKLVLSLMFCSSTLFSQNFTARLDSLFKANYKSSDPGAVAVILDQGKPIYKKGFGLANLKSKFPITSSTSFNIGSLTKQFTAYAILQLWQEKKLSLDDKLIKFFPEFNPRTGNLISIKQLLTHSSGILDHYEFTDTVSVRHATDKTVLEAVKDLDTTYFVPGSRFRYSNTGYCLLALIVEKVSGLEYSEYLKKFIFHPLLMHESTVFKMGDQGFQRAVGYQYDSSSKKFRELDAMESIFFSTEGDGGIYTSADDYLKWCISLDQGKGMDKALVEKAQTPQISIDSSKGLSYGFGWFVHKTDGGTTVYFIDPSRNFEIFILSNRSDLDLETILENVKGIFGIR